MTISSSEDTIDVTPHPRLLAVLGDIEFAPWQCLAELVDNAFDDFLVAPPEGETPRVAISLPGRNSNRKDAQVWITDNGRGMSLEHLTGAASAGWPSNAESWRLLDAGRGLPGEHRLEPRDRRDSELSLQCPRSAGEGRGSRCRCHSV